MSPKVLAQTGISLPDMYEIAGGVGSGVDEIETQTVHTVHEMGATIMSERLQQVILSFVTGDIAASTDFGVTLTGLIEAPSRLLGVSVVADSGSRTNNLAVLMRTADTGSEFPIFVWDDAVDVELLVRMSLLGGTVATLPVLVPSIPMQSPNLLAPMGASPVMPEFAVRGTTTAFGAGTVESTVLLLVARPSRDTPGAGEPSSVGLPFPSW